MELKRNDVGGTGMPSREFVCFVERLSRRAAWPKDIETMRRAYEAFTATFPKPFGTNFKASFVGGVPCEWTHPVGGSSRSVVFYLHGGGHVAGSPRTHRHLVAEICRSAGAVGLSVDFGLAPEHGCRSQIEEVVGAYSGLLSLGIQGRDIVVCADSSGGGLALAAVQQMKGRGIPMPSGLLLLSPWVDLSMTGESVILNAEADPVVSVEDSIRSAERYAGEMALDDPLVSPLFGDLTGLPDMVLFCGSREVLLDDSVRLAEGVRRAGGNVELHVGQGMVHVWPWYIGFFPEAEIGAANAGKRVRVLFGQ